MRSPLNLPVLSLFVTDKEVWHYSAMGVGDRRKAQA